MNDLPLVVSRAEIQKLRPVCLTGETGSCHNALSGMDQLIPFLIVFALGFAAGYGVREWRSRLRRRRLSRLDGVAPKYL